MGFGAKISQIQNAPTRPGPSFGLGVAFVSGPTRWRCPEGVVLLPIVDLDLPLPFALVWRKDNRAPLLAKFVADVRLLPEVKAFGKEAEIRS